MPTKPRTQEIVSLFSRYLHNDDSTLIENLTLEELEAAEIDLGWRDANSSFRLALQKRIGELKQEKQDKIKKQENKEAKRTQYQNLTIGVLTIVVTVVIALIGWLA